jgi:hypothetical protein
MLLPITHPNEFSLAANDMQDGQFVPVETPGAEGAWARMAARAHSWPGPGSDHVRVARFSEQDHVQRIANSLAPATLHLIVMARCRADVLPSLYQEKIKMVDPTSPGKTSSAPTAPPTMRGGTPPALSSADGYRTSTSSA